MSEKEATARIKINRLLEAAGWRFFQEGCLLANICLEPSVTINSSDFGALGANSAKNSKGVVDFLFFYFKGFPLIGTQQRPSPPTTNLLPVLSKKSWLYSQLRHNWNEYQWSN
ncbi:hypothetical protein [Chrysiogenes arsenatis]|uniref:hypothetical protein n=1 Tax=Chrysiogenes arsenatis TaxID=309797 RepID=UPI0003F6C243|nr:hypothetical protein [Chrysiogenes arsenatis]